MRRYILILAIAAGLFVPFWGFSQTLVGIRGGITLPTPTLLLRSIPEDGSSVGPRFAFSGGVQYIASNQDLLSLELQMLWLQYAYTVVGEIGRMGIESDSYLSLPILLRISQSPGSLRFFGFVGPELEYHFDETSQFEGKTTHALLNGDPLKLSLLFGFGLEKTLSEHLTCSLDLGYQISLRTLDLLDSDIHDPMADNLRLMFGMMYAMMYAMNP
jgi:hypothetical protein